MEDTLNYNSNWRRPQVCYRQPRELIYGMQPYFNPNRWDMEDNLNHLKVEDDLIFFKWKTTSIFFKLTTWPKINCYFDYFQHIQHINRHIPHFCLYWKNVSRKKENEEMKIGSGSSFGGGPWGKYMYCVMLKINIPSYSFVLLYQFPQYCAQVLFMGKQTCI